MSDGIERVKRADEARAKLAERDQEQREAAEARAGNRPGWKDYLLAGPRLLRELWRMRR